MNNSMFPKKPIIKKYKKRNSFFSNNRINTIKFPSLNNIKFKTRNFKLNDNLSNRKIKNFSSENVLHPNSNDSLNKIVFKKIKLKKKNNSNTLPIY